MSALALLLPLLFTSASNPQGLYSDPSNGSVVEVTSLPRARSYAVTRRWPDGRMLLTTLQPLGGPVWLEWRPEMLEHNPVPDGESEIRAPVRAPRTVPWDVSAGGVRADGVVLERTR